MDWLPGEWPGQRLDLNVVENENHGSIVGFGNQTAVLFSYGGARPDRRSGCGATRFSS
jgi:hypothetical protein